MKPTQWIGWYAVLFLSGVVNPATGWASDPQAEITHLVIKNTEDSLRVDLKVDSDVTPEMKAAVLKGVPIRFTISIGLYEVTDFWFDKQVAGLTAIHELRFDPIKKVYKITRSRGILRPTYIEDFDSARLHMSEISNLAVISLADLKKGTHYQLMVGAVLSLKKFLLFNLYRELKTDRYTVNFIY